MSEPAVDVDSKTSLAKRWWVLAKADIAKGAKAYTSVGNWVFMGISVWLAVGPYFAAQGAQQAQNAVASLSDMVSMKDETIKQLNSDLQQNKAGFEAVKQDVAKLSLDLDACRADPPAKSIEKTTKQEAALTPPINKVKVRKVPAVKQDDPTTWDQFVAWYEKNVGTPGVN